MSNRTRSGRTVPPVVRALRAAVERLEGRQLLSATHYVSPSGFGPGGVPALTTIAEVNNLDLQPGDSVLFRAGDKFTGSLAFDANDSGGLPTNAAGEVVTDASGKVVGTETDPVTPITVGTYHDGAPTTERATIASGAEPGLYFFNTQSVVVRDLIVVGGNAGTPAVHSGVEFRTDVSGTAKLHYIRVENVDVSGFGDYGIELQGTSGKGGYNDVRVEHVEVHGNTHGGISSTGLWDNTSKEYAHSNVYVGHANVYGNTGWAGSPNHSGSGIVLADIDGVVIERSVAYENGAANTHVGGPVGIWVWDVNDALIQYNESHHNLTNSTADGGGFDFDGGVTNSVMQHNYSHDNAGAGYGIYQFGGARSFYNNHIRYNVSVDDGRKNSYGAFDFWNGDGTDTIKDTYVYNNTVYVSPSTEDRQVTDRKGRVTTQRVKVGDPRALRFISGTEDVKVFNNNFYATGDVMLAQVDARQTRLQMNGNNWYHASPNQSAFKIKIFAKTYTNFDAYKTATGHDLAGVSKNPGFGAVSKPTYTVLDVGNWATDLGWLKPASDSGLAGKSVPFKPATSSNRIGPAYVNINSASTDFFGTDLTKLSGPAAVGASEVVTSTAT